MSGEKFNLGLLVGRFQTVHLGHEDMIRTALRICKRVCLFVGSAQESGTAKNPFPYEIRERLLRNVFGNSIEIYPLHDIGVGNNSRWGEYLLENIKERCGEYPDLFVSGKEARRVDWFDETSSVSIAELYIPKSIEISASQMREYFINDDRKSWSSYVSVENRCMYDLLRSMVLASANNTETSSL